MSIIRSCVGCQKLFEADYELDDFCSDECKEEIFRNREEIVKQESL